MNFRASVRHTALVFAGIALAVLLIPDTIARAVWRHFHIPAAVLYLPHRDPSLAVEMGRYYFGGEPRSYSLKYAERAYQKAIALNPKMPLNHHQLARVYFVKGMHSAALDEINLELAVNPENMHAFYVRGLINAYSGRFEAAEKDFLSFIAWKPVGWAAYNDLAWILSSLGKHKETKASIEKAFLVVPDGTSNPWLWNSLGAAELNMGNKAAAEKAFETALALASELKEPQWRLAYPGNDPALDTDGIKKFKAAIAENLGRSR